jgi:hypothetical protein
MYPITFRSERAQEILDCLNSGKPIGPGPCGWSIDGALAVAGACFFLAMSHGPITYTSQGIDISQFHSGHQEAVEETFHDDLHCAVDFYGQLKMAVNEDEFDSQYRPEVQALVAHDPNGENRVFPLRGFKGLPDRV